MAAIPFQPMMESRPIREIAYEVLKHAIITGEIPAGERIVETEYADRLHISRTPLREALRKLERDGLVEYVQRRGVIVRAFTIADVEEIESSIPRNMSREAFDRTSPSVSKILYQGYVNDVYSKLDIARHLNVGQNHIDKFLREVSKWNR